MTSFIFFPRWLKTAETNIKHWRLHTLWRFYTSRPSWASSLSLWPWRTPPWRLCGTYHTPPPPPWRQSVICCLVVTDIFPDSLISDHCILMTDCSSWQEASSITISPDTQDTRTSAEMRREAPPDADMLTGHSGDDLCLLTWWTVVSESSSPSLSENIYCSQSRLGFKSQYIAELLLKKVKSILNSCIKE